MFEIVEVVGKGRPKGVRLARQKNGVNQNTSPTDPAPDKDSRMVISVAAFRAANRNDPEDTQSPCGFQEEAIPVEGSVFTSPEHPKTDQFGAIGSMEEGDI